VNLVKESEAGGAGLKAGKQVAEDEQKLTSSEVEGEKVSYSSCPRATLILSQFLTDPRELEIDILRWPAYEGLCR